jgi:dolichol-phosphate mannosyltransferase/undecaprenyl-phosphate 4-deoxy-4-formamido-L-arabinose transferase
VSITVPVYNSGPTLAILCARIIQSLEKTEKPFEVIFVDDGSIDDSAEQLGNLALRDNRITVLKHSRNLGQSTAVLTGLRQTSGSIIVTLDDDLQHRPEDVPRLVQCLEDTSPRTLVIGVRANQRRPWWREAITKIANVISNLFLERPLPLKLTTFCCFHRSLAETLIGTPLWRGPWISTLVAAAERTVTVPVYIDPSLVRRSRYSGASLWKLFRQRTRLFVLRRIVIFTLTAFVVALGMAGASTQVGGLAGAGTAILAGISLFAGILGAALTFVSLAERHRLGD